MVLDFRSWHRQIVGSLGPWRVAFAFDPVCRVMLLVAGDKSGDGGRQFYRTLIRKSDERFDRHLARLADG